ncbi:hypothetical protein ITJ44_15610 [Clavibacter sp. VKM Ac-2873]|uniref:hypothetical protein n=1 Tax=Clavibacter sp. VKM Ac-2873 TaxID=2783813 RepID=UPI00188B42E2|nr:hypothetical protein [Clavibacter sp. VKM Ac-2873]MBF4619502.1 hypothetical protein [Clavibacter sp. VKM Ac-2873]
MNSCSAESARHPRLLQLALITISAFVACACLVVAPTAKASAVDAERTLLPVVAGTELDFPHSYCTAGLIVVRTGIRGNFSPAARATRYAVTAKHCGEMNSPVSVGGRRVGEVVWIDPVADLELVRIDPVVHGQPFCAPSSSGFHCSPVTYEPQATGQVLLATLRYQSLRRTPVAGTGAPASDEVFCISGKSSGQSCLFRSTRWISGYGEQKPGEVAAIGDTLVFPGDSGGPVLSPQARIYGIIAETATGSLHTVLKYTRISQFFEDAGNYALAPA